MEQEVQNVEVNETTTENVETQTTEQTEVQKTFTQEEVDNILKTRLRNMPSKEELKAFNDWKESQKTDMEKYQELVSENESLKKQITRAENMSVVANADIDEDFREFVLEKVSNMEGGFNKENLDSYIKDHQKYLRQKEEPVKTTGFSQNTNKPVSDEKAYLDKKYANNPFYKK